MPKDIRNAAPPVEVEQLSDEERRDLIQVIRQREASYGFLSRLFRLEVDQVVLDELRAMRFPVHTGNSEMDEGYRLIATYLANVWANSLTELSLDFSRVFIGCGVDAYSAAYPFESVYTSAKRLMKQEAHDEVFTIYRKAGLTKSSTWKEGEDHISLEMEYLQVLCQRTIQVLEAGDENATSELLSSQLEFLNNHLAAWVPMMIVDMKRFAQTEFYQGLAHLAEGFLETDRELLEDIISADDES